MNEPSYTLHFSDGGFQDNDPEEGFAADLPTFIKQCAERGWRNVAAWSPGYEPGTMEQCDAAIAAGRTIDYINGKYVVRGEPIAPTFYCAAETIKPAIDWASPFERSHAGAYERNRQMRDALDKMAAAEKIKPAIVINRPGMKFVATVPAGLSVTTADLHMVARDDKRAPLESQSAGRYDPFKGFTVTRDTATPDHAYSHYLTRVADAGAQTPPVCGSAWLVVR